MIEKQIADLTKVQWLTLWWVCFWRGLIVTLGVGVAGLFTGFVIGVLAAMVVVPLHVPKSY
jgi:ABC-type amino acid transport system permease subunit